ncbi:hypothetical protein GQ55_9G238800 [Panicum hallii var. hallii]|uniref:Transmembrane protein n=1 Tax=Panicum hallii var. hallii TaxID=1504633 RepID=A0A2T7C6M2_9POAL|nr:hypothetical protein GQ55_9G238800 [Panicum hallii var. hallii]
MMGLLRYMKDLYIGPPRGKGVIQDLEHAMRTKGGLTLEEDEKLRIINSIPSAAFVLFSGFGSFVGWFAGTKLLKLPPSSRFTRFCSATGCAYIMGKGMYSGSFCRCPVALLETEEGRMKMELANIILTKHSDDEYLVEAVKRHFFAEHLFDDLHQDQPFFRWHPRRSYTNSAFVERMKEIKATNSDDEARTVSGGTTADNGPSGDLMEDPFACILGSPGHVESNNPPGNISTVLKRSELRARRSRHRHHHRRHADDKFAAL